jgi:hypothetical protein
MSSGLRTYKGACHCGAFKFSVRIPPLTPGADIWTCDCSICQKQSYIWVVPKAGDVTIEKGVNALESYSYGANKLDFQFCPKCGTAPIWRTNDSTGEALYGVNIRALLDVDYWALAPIKMKHGSTIPSTHSSPKVSTKTFEQNLDQGQKIYTGSCHCGAVTLALRNKALPQEQLIDCDCSICGRAGTIWHYSRANQIELRGKENLTAYGKGSNPPHKIMFCKSCGVCIYNFLVIPEWDDAWSEERKKEERGRIGEMPININVLDGVVRGMPLDGVEWDKLQILQYRGSRQEPLYIVPE